MHAHAWNECAWEGKYTVMEDLKKIRMARMGKGMNKVHELIRNTSARVNKS